MLLYFCQVFCNKRLTLKVLPTPDSDIVISFDLFPTCFVVRMVSNMFRNRSRLSNIRSYLILLHKIGITLQPLILQLPQNLRHLKVTIRNICEDLEYDIRHIFKTAHHVKRFIDANGNFLTD